MNITGKPLLFHKMGVIGYLVLSDKDVTITFAVEPIIVPLPPRPAPKASAHHKCVTSKPIIPNSSITGIKAIVIGILSTIADGDSVLTTSGFYGVVIDVMDEIVIVEFGNNKNCRIPIKKAAIVEVEKPNSGE